MGDGDDWKCHQLFEEKIGVTPSVADPGDNHPSDATGRPVAYSLVSVRLQHAEK